MSATDARVERDEERSAVLRTFAYVRTVSRHFLVRVLLVFALCRAFSAAVIAVVATHQAPTPSTGSHVSYLDMTTMWDGQWFSYIAQEGYPSRLPTDPVTGEAVQNPFAFYPAFPLLARAVMAVTDLPFQVVGPLLALVAAFCAVAIIAVLLRERLGQGKALAAVAVFAAYPSSSALQIAYSDSLGLLLVAGFLLALTRERWTLAAALALATGLTRAVATPLLVVTLVACWLRWRRRGAAPLTMGELFSAGAAVLACGISGLIWPAVVWQRTGDQSAYFDTMSAWGYDPELIPFKLWFEALAEPAGAFYSLVIGVPLALAFVGPWARALGPYVQSWCIAYSCYLMAFAAPATSLYRYTLFLFPLGVVALGAAWRDRAVTDLKFRTGLLVALGLAGQVWWVWALLQFHPPLSSPP